MDNIPFHKSSVYWNRMRSHVQYAAYWLKGSD